MKFSVGDRIILKHSGEEGHVIALIDNDMVEVDVGGTVFPTYIDDIDHPYLKWFTEKKTAKKKSSPPGQLQVEKQEQRKQRLAKGIYLSFLPVFKTDDPDNTVDYLKVFLLNELQQEIKFFYDVHFNRKSAFSHQGALHAFGNLYLHNIVYTDMSDQPRFHWRFTENTGKDAITKEGILRIRPAKLFEQVNAVLHKSEPTFSYLLIEDFLPEKQKEKKEIIKPLVIKPQNTSPPYTASLENPKYELDLHIEQLVDDKKGLSNDEIIKIQLDTFLRYLHLAIVHKQEKMFVIHGVGKGKLREEVHRILKQTPEVEKFINEWNGNYGFGATEIFFKY